MKISEIKNMTPDELKEKLTESINELRQLKFNHSVQSIENPLQIKVLRRQIAKMKSIINQKKEKIGIVTPKMSTRALRKERIGIVASNKMNKSVVISEVRKVKHPVYGKFVLKTKRYVAHDEKDECKEGDTVKIMETKPMSKTKRWRVVKIIERAK